MILSLVSLIRSLIGWFDLVLVTIVVYLFSFIPNKLFEKQFHHLFRYWCKVFIRALRVELFVHQQNLRPLPTHYIVIANHPSAFEDLGMSALFDVRYLAKEEMREWWILGRISKAAGTFYVKRECKDSRREAANMLKMALTQGKNIGIYPEGGCKGRRIFTPFLYGAFDLSLETNTPVIPVFLHYEAQQDFEWHNQHLLHKLWMIFRAKNHRANYYVFDALLPSDFASKELFCEHVQNLYLTWQNRYLV